MKRKNINFFTIRHIFTFLLLFLILTGFTTVSAQEEILIDYYDYLYNDSSVQLINIGDMTGQALTLNNTTYITKISVLAGKQFGTFNYSGVIYNVTGTVGTDARGVKPALAYSSNSITQDEIPTVPTFAILNFTFDPAVELEAGDYLFGAEKTSGAFSISNVAIDLTTPTHYGNGAWYVSGWGWDNETDTIFYLYGYYPEPSSPFEISNVTSIPSATSSLIAWDVNQTTNNRVEYGLTTDLGSWSVWDNNTSTPEITISGLTVNTTYYYSVWSHHINDSSISINSSIYNFTTGNYPYIINWSNNNTNNQNLTIYSNLGDLIHFNVSANQNITAWTWNVDSVNYSQGFDNITLSFNTNKIYEVAAFGINENGTTNVITWTIVIGDIQILIYEQNQAIIEEERMMGLSILLTMLVFTGIVFFLLGILLPNSILTVLGSITFFITMLLPIPILENYSYFGIALTLILLMFGIIGIIITFYQWFTIYTEPSFRKWDEDF
jgi:hypothetical protein